MLNILGSLVIVVLLVSWLVNPEPVSAAETTTVSISAPSSVSNNETFAVSINIEPGVAIAGVQFDLSFDPSLVTASQVEEGDLLTQNGASTYFNPGTINNETGNISGVVGIITSPGQTVATPGTFALITLTAATQNGTCPLTLSNVMVGDAIANDIPVSVVNSEVTIGSSRSPGGGGGYYGGGGTPAGTTYLTDKIDDDGIFLTDVIAKSIDEKCIVTVKAGVEGLNKYGKALEYITILNASETPEPPEGSTIIGLVYDISPDGATFGPTANLTIIYDSEQLPEGITEDEMYIAYWDDSQWIAFESLVDSVRKESSAGISHFTPFTIIAPPSQAEEPEPPPPTEPSPPTSTPEPASFAVSDLSVTPGEVKPNEQVTISAVITNIGGSEGNYTAILKIDGVEAGSEEVNLRAGESQIVSFSIIGNTVGTFTININGIEGSFVVIEELVQTLLGSGLLRVNPQLDITTGKLTLVKMNYQFNEPRESLSGVELVLQVNLDDNPLETVPVLLPSELGTDGINGSLDYVPSQGWSRGTHTFQVQLYEGDKLLNYTNLEEFEVTPELVAKEVQWVILGVIIECALAVIVFVVLVVLHRNRVDLEPMPINR